MATSDLIMLFGVAAQICLGVGLQGLGDVSRDVVCRFAGALTAGVLRSPETWN